MTDVASGIVGTTGRAVAEAAGEAVRRRLSSEPDGRAAVAAFDSGPQEPAAQAELCRVLVQVMSTEPQFAVQLTALVPVPAPAAPVPPLPPAPPPPAEPPRIGRDGIIIDGRSRNTGNLALGDQLIQNIRRGDPRTVLLLILALVLVVAAGYGGTRLLTDDSPDPKAAATSAAAGATDRASDAAAATGGGSSGNPSATTGPSASRPSGPPRPEPVRADPPVKFTRVVTGSADPDLRPLVLDGLDVVSVEGVGSLISRDVRDGEQTAEMTSGGKLPTGSLKGLSNWLSGNLELARPAVGTSGGKRYAVAAFPRTITGQGTVSDHYGFEVDILDLDTHKEAGRVTVDEGTIGNQIPVVAGIAAGRALVVAAGLTGPPTSYAIDLATRTVAWKASNYEARLLQGDTVVGVSSTTGEWDTYFHEMPLEVRALAAADGAVRWKALSGEVKTSLSVFATDKILAHGEREPTLLSTGTGESLPVPALTEKYTLDTSSCRFDGRATTVCWASGTDGGQLLGIDAAGVTVLWQIVSSAGPGARVAPSVTAVWHGAVYGQAQNGRNVVLDARTGQDREYEPGTAPDHVNEYAALSGDTFYLSAG
ncbi:hypothetical protein ADK60_37655 [Streptomyces sp. XY431]|uniref:outer membrane protein assembly factor BamB family protein n=1 Tax=Streptomyces sp. XY431 TaxID=1415562 RepID=UPI0006AEEB96|nr:PQQ-binding-like beta-propeller repeat protein [Streptomyces sp. XY431]KOV10691.1 hypothetical protein ADK60_37655 [Streptomyces sp. XY431]